MFNKYEREVRKDAENLVGNSEIIEWCIIEELEASDIWDHKLEHVQYTLEDELESLGDISLGPLERGIILEYNGASGNWDEYEVIGEYLGNVRAEVEKIYNGLARRMEILSEDKNLLFDLVLKEFDEKETPYPGGSEEKEIILEWLEAGKKKRLISSYPLGSAYRDDRQTYCYEDDIFIELDNRVGGLLSHLQGLYREKIVAYYNLRFDEKYEQEIIV